MKNVLKSLLLLSFLFIAFACDNEPYPEDAENGDLRRNPRRETNPPTVAMSIILPSEDVTLFEGKPFVQKIKVAVPNPGKPIVEVENLPKGAIFDPEELTITWKPGFTDGNDPKDPTIKVRRYLVTVRLFTTEPGRENEKKERVLPLSVYDVPRIFEIDAKDKRYLKEGETLSYEFEINNEDYPQGPFNVYSSDIPANAKIVRINDTQFRLEYTPDYHHVKLNGNAQDCMASRWKKLCYNYVGKLTAINPAGHKAEKEIKIEIEDKRQHVELSTPSDMENGLDISFSVSAIDPNGEIAPEISMDSLEPEFGEFTTELTKDEENNFSVLHVKWSDIPPSHNGQKKSFSFKSCALSSPTSTGSCKHQSFAVTIKVKERKAPVFERSSWEIGEVKYFKYNDRFTTYIRVKDGDSFQEVDNVVVLPESMRKNIVFNGGSLEIRGIKKPGIHQFTLSATSEYNVTSAESFVFEVFDKKRARTIYFTDSTRDAEVKFYRDTMKDVELMNPVLQPLNKRNLSGRDTLIVGTGILTDPDRKDDLSQAMNEIRNVVVASPLVRNMPDEFLRKLQSEFRVSITGRYSDISGAPELKNMYFVARSDLDSPKDKIGLNLDSTPESFDPLIFSVGVDRVNCQDVLDFTDQGEESLFKIGVICDRKTSGRFVILGTEFADLKTAEEDEEIPAKWLRSMLKTPLNTGSAQ